MSDDARPPPSSVLEPRRHSDEWYWQACPRCRTTITYQEVTGGTEKTCHACGALLRIQIGHPMELVK